MLQATTLEPKLTIDWLNKLVMMAQWERGQLPFHFVSLFGAPEAYQRFLGEVRNGTTDNTDITDQAVKTAREKLLKAVASWPSLREMFGADVDPFEGAPLEHLQLLAEVSDITTDSQRMIWSRNGTFIAVVEALRQSQDFEAEALIVDWLNKFFTLLDTDEKSAEAVYNLAKEPYWLVILASLRDGRDYTGDEDPIVGETLRSWPAGLWREWRELLFKPGHLSRAPAKLIRMAWNNKQLFVEARNSIPADKRDQNPTEERKQVVNEALKLFKAGAEYVQIEGELVVLATVARHFINVRKFAKLDGFVYTWPDIARIAMSNYPALEYVEDLLVNRKPRPLDADLDTREARDLYELCVRNDRLIRFLRLRPRFAEIDDDELRRYRPLAPVVISESTVQAAARGVSGAADLAPPPSHDTAPPPAPAKALENTYVEIVPEYSATPANADEQFYALSLAGSGYSFGGHLFGLAIKLLEQLRAAIGVGSDSELQSMLRDLFATSATQAEARLTWAGSMLFNQVFSSEMRAQFGKLLSDNKPLRVVIKSSEKEPHYLPWEWLPGLSPSQLFLSTPEHSVVRHFTPPREDPGEELPSPLVTPLKLISIIPPAPVGQRFTSDITIRALQGIVSTEPVEYMPVVRSEATLDKVRLELKVFNPHVVHFEGYLTTPTKDPNDNEILVYFGGGQAIPLHAFGKDLANNGVQLLVIGRNSMAQIYQNLAAQATFVLIQQGLPAVIAPMRAIDDASATTFTTEFYRAFIQGNTLESALHIARRKLASKGGDWSVFALFANPAQLDQFQLLRETALS